jgi:hypothetical protein
MATVWNTFQAPAATSDFNFYTTGGGGSVSSYIGFLSPGSSGFTLYAPGPVSSTLNVGDPAYISDDPFFDPTFPSGNYFTATYQGETQDGGTFDTPAGLPVFSNITGFGSLAPNSPNYGVLGTDTPLNFNYTAATFCFLSGTHITTPSGEVLVEDFKIGDLVSTADGGTRKVLWIGKQTVSSLFAPTKNLPIEIAISAFGNNLPTRPLRVSPGHSLLVSGVFPIASALVNDVTVRQLTKEELPDTFTYYHIEVEDHALILAEGVPAETFLDASSRRAFSNFNEYVELYGEEEREVPRSDLHYKRILKFDNLPQELKETIGYPLSHDEAKVA